MVTFVNLFFHNRCMHAYAALIVTIKLFLNELNRLVIAGSFVIAIVNKKKEKDFLWEMHCL